MRETAKVLTLPTPKRERKTPRARYTGSLYQPRWKDKQGRIRTSTTYWMKFYVEEGGKSVPHRESTGESLKKRAEGRLRERLEEVGRHEFIAHDLRYPELRDLLYAEYKREHNRSLLHGKAGDYLSAARPLDAFFGDCLVKAIGPLDVDRLKDKMIADGYSPATVNGTLAILRRMLLLAVEKKLVRRDSTPKVKLFPRAQVPKRTGFFTPGEYRALLAELPAHLKPVLVLAYHVGMRRGECLRLQWSRVDLPGRLIRLRAEDCKNKLPRNVPLFSPVLEAIEAQQKKHAETCPDSPWVFFHADGQPIRSSRKAWLTACKRGGVAHRIFHDLRRSATKNLMAAGVPLHAAMAITGHCDPEVFRAYDVQDDQAVQEAAKQLEGHFGQSTGKVE